MDTGNVAHSVAEAAHGAGSGVVGEVTKLGKSAFSQLFGHSENDDLKHHEIKEKTKVDDEQSEVEHKAKVKALYDEFYAKKKRQEQIEAQHEERQEEAKQLEDLNEHKVTRQQQGLKTQIGKSRTEIGRNFGQE